MPLSPGASLGPYEILGPLGAGGMGEVYKARDTRLQRTVAIKILPPHWAATPEMRTRFEREAQTIASLNHPNICTLHDIGHAPSPESGDAIDYLVMEHLEGETLSQRLERGALPLDEALQVAIEVADALDKAHRQGVVHRDLKPGNIFLARGGPSDPPTAKLLDFGLAKLNAPGGPGYTASTPPAVSNLTSPGTLLGTLQYMAPEQLEGADADPRSDIFSFGAVVHEMITGRKAFEGKSRVLLMSAIATAEPAPLSSEQRPVPPALEHVVRACLAKNPADRWQTARDLLSALQLIADGGADAGVAANEPRPRRRLFRVAAAAAAVLVVTAVATPAALYMRSTSPAKERRFRLPISLTSQPEQVFYGDFSPADMDLSADGRMLAFVARRANQEPWMLYVRPLGSIAATPLTDTVDATQPFWSPDGAWIGFVSRGRLKKVESSGGPAQDLGPATNIVGASWNADGTIVFGTPQGLFRISAEGGAPVQLTKLAESESGHFWPHFLPDGRRYLYLAWSNEGGRRAVMAGELDADRRTRVMAAESKAEFVEPGYLVFRREYAIYAQRFDSGSLTVSGDAVRIADEVTASGSPGDGNFVVSQTGVLAYLERGAATLLAGSSQSEFAEWQVVWISRGGAQQETVGRPGVYRGVEVSPDGTRVAVHEHDNAGGSVIVLEPRNRRTTLTFDASRHSSMPIWSPRGERIAYAALQNGKWGLYQNLSDGSGLEELLHESDLPAVPLSWSPDGNRIVFSVEDPKTGGDLWVYTFDGGEKKVEPIVSSPANETHGQISPNGRWLAYTSNKRNNRDEVYVRPFPTGSGEWQPSTDGGDWPRWSPDGTELFFHSLGSGAFVGPLLSVPVTTTGPIFQYEKPKEVVTIVAMNFPHAGGGYHSYAVHPKRDSFLVYAFSVPDTVNTQTFPGADPSATVIVAMNWVDSLPR